MNDCVVLKPNGVLVYSCPRPAVGLRSTATSGSKPGWKFETTVGVSNPGLGSAIAGAAATSAAATTAIEARACRMWLFAFRRTEETARDGTPAQPDPQRRTVGQATVRAGATEASAPARSATRSSAASTPQDRRTRSAGTAAAEPSTDWWVMACGTSMSD